MTSYPYSLDQTPLSNNRRSRMEAAPPDALKESVRSRIVAARRQVARAHIDKEGLVTR